MDDYYGAPFEHKGYSNAQKNILHQVDQKLCLKFVMSSLLQPTEPSAINQTQVTVQKIRKEIEEKLRLHLQAMWLKKKESEYLQLNILVLLK